MNISDPIWDGITRPETLHHDAAFMRQQLAGAARSYHWDSVLSILSRNHGLVNTTRLGSQSLYTPLHQAAHGGAPTEIVEQLLHLGAWRTLRTAQGERPVDIAERHGHKHLLDLLRPVLQREVPAVSLQQIQHHFHAVISGRAEELVRDHALRLPELEPLLEMTEPRLWFAVPGMSGGFHFWLDQIAGDAVLLSESWCRIVDGSGERHLVSPYGSLLIAQGFV